MPEYVIKRRVPILDEHMLRDEDGKPLARIDAARLQKIAERNNQRVSDTGDEVPIVIGHTSDDGKPEEQQPEVVGYARDFRVLPLFKTGRKAIHATFRFLKKKLDKCRQFPRRSVELWLDNWTIDPISLLGATTPERDLGLLKLSRAGRGPKGRRILPIKLEKNCMAGSSSDQDGMVQKVLAALQQTDVWKFMEQQMQQGEQDAEMPEGDDMGMEGGMGMEGDPGLGSEDEFGDEGAEMDLPEEGEEDDEPVKYGAGYASGTNTFPPSGVKSKRKPAAPAPRQPARRARQGRSTRPSPNLEAEVIRYQRATGLLTDQVSFLTRQLNRSQREKDLIRLQSEERIDLDVNEELDLLEALPQEQYQKRLQNIRTRYAKVPVERGYSGQQGRSVSLPGQQSREDMMAIADYASREGISYQEALAQREAGEPVF